MLYMLRTKPCFGLWCNAKAAEDPYELLLVDVASSPKRFRFVAMPKGDLAGSATYPYGHKSRITSTGFGPK
jgi:hypothetical protein